MDVHDTIGFDLVGMVVDDLVVCGAEPLFMTDYIATGRVVPERIAAIVKGIAEACVEAGCALVGGETAEHPGLLGPDEYDVAGATTGVVEADELLGPGRVRPGDVVIAMASSGLHSNGYSLVRHVLLEKARLGARPRTSTSSAAPSARSCSSRPGSTPRPASTLADRDRHPRDVPRHRRRAGRQPRAGAAGRARAPPSTARTWTPQPVFDLVRRVGDVPQPDLEATLNCGVGMVALTAPRTSTRRSRCSPSTASGPGSPARCRSDAGRGGGRRAGRSAPRLVTSRGRDSVRRRITAIRVCGNSQPAGSVGPTRTL